MVGSWLTPSNSWGTRGWNLWGGSPARPHCKGPFAPVSAVPTLGVQVWIQCLLLPKLKSVYLNTYLKYLTCAHPMHPHRTSPPSQGTKLPSLH